jgi:beta-lactam-binding protein with PASTA domain
VVEAMRILPRAGFRVSAIKVVKSQKEAGTVMRTKPSAGSAVEPGTPVVPVMSGGPTGIPPGIWSGDVASGAATRYAN